MKETTFIPGMIVIIFKDNTNLIGREQFVQIHKLKVVLRLLSGIYTIEVPYGTEDEWVQKLNQYPQVLHAGRESTCTINDLLDE